MASEQLATNILEEVEKYKTPPAKMRHAQEVSARYQLRLKQYRELNESRSDNRDQRLMIYTEIKVLGWVLGMPEKNVLKDINECTKTTNWLGM